MTEDVKIAIRQVLDGDYNGMQETLNGVFAEKAVEKLDAFKVVIAQNYFGQQEPVDEDTETPKELKKKFKRSGK